MWLETTLGVRYSLPDMLIGHVDMAHRQLDQADKVRLTTITLVNVSDVVLTVPYRILAKAGVGDRCFWEKR
jgi:hypothetical protein